MKVDRFMSRLGIAAIETVPDEALRTLCETAEAFVRAGVRLTFDDALDMNEATLTAFIKANELVKDEDRSLLVAELRGRITEDVLDKAADEALEGLVETMSRRAAS